MSKNLYKNILVIGDGAWGSALAITAAINAKQVSIYTRSQEVANSINNNHINPKSFADIKLPINISGITDPKLFREANLILLAIPAQAFKQFLTQNKEFIPSDAPVVICSKGIDNSSLNLLSDICKQVIPLNSIAILSGPNFASEIALHKHSATLIACEDEEIGLKIIHTLSHPTFRCYCANDTKGVEIAGAAKNVIAIAAGIIEGLNLGENAKAALVTRGLNEITRLSIALGGKLETIFGLAGVGDLILTCGSKTSRNMSLGFMLAEGKDLGDILSEGKTYEGYFTSLSIHQLCQKLNLELPIFNAVYNILYQESNIADEIEQLVNRPLKAERF